MVASRDPPSATGATVTTPHSGSSPDTLGRYRLLKKIAKGGMAEVYAARSYGAHGFEKTVAIKRILPKFGRDPQFVRMMVDEAKISVLLNHPNIAQVLELGEQDGDYFIVMEFVPGVSLSTVVKRLRERDERIPTLDACFIVVELLQGLHSAHVQRDARGALARIIHRDVSPQNCLISYDGHVKVIDFGIARARNRLEATEVGTIKGKLRYLAPEMIDPGRFTKEGDFDHRVDIFAAGVVLWELVANRTLFTGDDEMKVYEAITDGRTPDLVKEGSCDAALMKIIARALERDLPRRYPTAEEFADDLRAYVYRSDAAYTHKRVAAMLEKTFASERAEALGLERGVVDDELPGDDPATVAPAHKARGSGPGRAARANAETATLGGASPAASPTSGPQHAAADPTRQLRSDARRQAPAARVEGAQAFANAPTLLVDAPRGLAEELAEGRPAREELTVMTLVSRQHVLGDHPSLSTGTGNVFASASDEATRTSAAQIGAGVTATERVGERTDKLRARQTREGDATTGAPRAGGRMMAAAVGVGAGLALLIVAALELLGPARSVDVVDGARPATTQEPAAPPSGAPAVDVPTQAPVSPQPDAARAAIAVPVRANLPGASVVMDGVEKALPTTLQVAAGAALDLDVRAPGAAAHVEHVVVPTTGDSFPVDVVLQWEPVAVTLDASPRDATVVVDGKPWAADLRVAPGRSVVVDATAAGHAPYHAVVDAAPGAPLHVRVTMTPARATTTKQPAANAAARGTGTLILKTTPVWGQVTIDGKTWDETTPLTVELRAGTHDVVVAHPPRKLERRFKVIVKERETVTRTISFDAG